MLTQKNLTNFYHAMKDKIAYLQDGLLHPIVSITTVSFDIFGFETLISLANGLHLFMTNYYEQKTTEKLEKLIKEKEIEIIQTTPSVMRFHLDHLKNKEDFANLKYVMLAGEQLPLDLVNYLKEIAPNCTIYNGYGPSETTIFSSVADVTNSKEITIGKPIANTQFYILDEQQKLLPKHHLGEIYISGDGVGKGYLFQSELTKKNFLPNPFSFDSLLYRTGDLGQWQEDGSIICKGRVDHQVKLHGLRIELGEVESKMNTFGKKVSLKSCVLVKELEEKKYLCAFYQANDAIIIEDLKNYLLEVLPNYMIPTYFIKLDVLPQTPNGKTDRKALMNYCINTTNKNIVLPKDELEQNIYDLIASIIGNSGFSMKDDFFVIGMDSLNLIRFASHIQNNFGIDVSIPQLYRFSSISDFSDFLRKMKKSDSKWNIEKNQKQEYQMLSSAQKRVYLSCKTDPNSILYNMPGYIRLPKQINLEKLKLCFIRLMNRHEILRSQLIEKDATIFSRIISAEDFNFSIERLCYKTLEEAFSKFVKPFDLKTEPLLRVAYLTLSNEQTYLLLDIHHIICDGSSLNLMIQELCDLYQGKSQDENLLCYSDYAVWEQQHLENYGYEREETFWLNELSNLPVLDIPYDHERPKKLTYLGDKYCFEISSVLSTQVKNFCQHLHITPYMFFLACYEILLAKYCMQEDVIVGSPSANRIPGKTDKLLGMFVNNLVITSCVKDSDLIKDFFHQVKEKVLHAFANQAYPFNELVNHLPITRQSNRNPIFDTMFIYQNDGYLPMHLENEQIHIHPISTKTAKFDLSFEILPKEAGADVTIEYATDLFENSSIEVLADTYLHLISELLQKENQTIGDLEIASNFQKELILNNYNNTKTDYPRNSSIATLFEEQVEKTPNHTAVVFGTQSFTYQELNVKANQLSHYLHFLGVTKESIVCILLDKSLEMIIAILAILKAGGAYLPIDVNYPKERIDYMIRDSKSKILLTNLTFVEKSNSTIQSICIDLTNENIYANELTKENLKNDNESSDLAYIMYTSGSTGNPKGTMIEQKSVIRLVKNTNYIHFQDSWHILQTGSIVFDACTFEIWGALLHGATLYLIPKSELLDPTCLETYLLIHKIDVLWLTAPLFNQLCEENPSMFHDVKYLLTGGDVLSPKHIRMVRTANPDLKVINGYGPTENTTFSCCFSIEEDYKNSIPIGYPISNSNCYVVSSSGKLLPTGFAGELWVGGDGVARGYLNRDDLNKEKFIPNPYHEGKLYKTGDLVRWLNHGCVQFFGRIDNQVKIHGFRVELNEINITLSKYPNIKECTTVVQTIHGEKTICSYFVANQKIDLLNLKAFLKNSLPIYMVPPYLIEMKQLPINTNGKIDKKALPTNFKKQRENTILIKPESKLEELLLQVYQKVLNYDEISVTDSFFDLGGDSLGAMKIELEALSLGVSIRYADIFRCPSVRELASCSTEKPNLKNNTEIDYSKYDVILKNNIISDTTTLPYTSMGNVLLTGFTGFLGAHILDSFLRNETGNIYCLIREKNNMTAMDRLKNVLHFYFDTRYDKYIGSRIQLIEGDITLDQLGLDDNSYCTLGKKITTVIHSAAMVKHFGELKLFEEINIMGTKRIVEFCKKFSVRLMHISTISVSGNALAEQSFVQHNFTEDKDYQETNFYIGQNIENLYIKSKFEAEAIVLDAISDGLPAYILRMGNLTSRFSEGKFQQNHFENAFVNRFKSILQIGYAPDYLLDSYVEFTPIDYCGDAIIALASHYHKDFSIFHLLNEKHVTMQRLFDTMIELGVSLKIVSSDEFISILNKLLKDDLKKNYLEGIINDLDENKKLVYESNIKIKSDFSTKVLEKIGFSWPYIDTRYIYNYLKYLADIGYFHIKIN